MTDCSQPKLDQLGKYLEQQAYAEKIPLKGTFELTARCNFNCNMCYVHLTEQQIKSIGCELSNEQWLEIARQARDAGMLYLTLTGGEVFARPGFRELYQKLHDMGFLIYINSNGTMIDEETVQWLKQQSPVRVNITLYGASRETYRRICGHADGYDRAMHAIHLLQDAGIPVVSNASMIPENACDLEKIMSVGKELNINTRVATYMFPPMRRSR